MFSKKTAVAAAALLAAFAAQAQVTLYGNLDVSIGRTEEPFGAESATAVSSGALRESFIGFKGEEDLGGGLKGFFKLESAIAVDTGAADTPFWDRTSVVGLTGDFGTVALGNARSLIFLANDAYNPFRADSGLFSTSQNLFGRGNYKNSITYSTPNISGFNAGVQVGLSEQDGVDNAVGFTAGYAAGPLGVNFTYEDVPQGATDEDVKSWLLGASYDFGAAKLFGQVGQSDNSLVDEKYKFFQIGAAIPVTSAGNILVTYAQAKQDDVKAKDFSLAYEHTLSKRTGAYIGVNNTRLDTGAADDNGTSFAVGVRHSF